jgi:hypothetical protein
MANAFCYATRVTGFKNGRIRWDDLPPAPLCDGRQIVSQFCITGRKRLNQWRVVQRFIQQGQVFDSAARFVTAVFNFVKGFGYSRQ